MSKVKGYRVMMNFTQQQMADRLNISRQSYSEKERGNIPFKDDEKLFLKKLFLTIDENITIDSLFFN